MNKILKLKIREQDGYIFNAIKNGKKKIETRAATKKYKKVAVGDIIEFVCGKHRFKKQVESAENFRTISGLLKKYKPQQINPAVKTNKELREMYHNFPNYKEKIRKYGLVAWKLK
jgi:ASC-1-like (ASCH) protein